MNVHEQAINPLHW